MESLESPNGLSIQGRQGTYLVDDEGCSCDHSECPHRRIYDDLSKNAGGQMKWVMVSAMDKEIRRGVLGKALHWADWRKKIRGQSYVKGM